MSSAIEGLLGGVLKQFGGGDAMGIVQKVAPALIGMLGGGGAAKLLKGFTESGLGGKADSWVGTGGNEAVTSDQVTQALGADRVAQFAAQAGIPEDQAGEVLGSGAAGRDRPRHPGGGAPRRRRDRPGAERLGVGLRSTARPAHPRVAVARFGAAARLVRHVTHEPSAK